MTDFFTNLDTILGDDEAISDIIVTVRRCWYYQFTDFPVRIWQGQGKLHTSDGNVWLGTVDENGIDHHKAPAIQDGRDGSSPTYQFTLNLTDFPGQPAFTTYNALKAEQWRVANQKLTCYFTIFDPSEGLRPNTPLSFFKELTMVAPKFSEKMAQDNDGKVIKTYSASVTCKDGNSGRSEVPGGTYAQAIQRERAKQLGVSVDLGCEFLAILANRTYQLP